MSEMKHTPEQPAEGEEIMVNTPYDVFTLPLQPTGLSSGPRFVVHVPGPEHPAAVDGADAQAAEIEALRAERADIAEALLRQALEALEEAREALYEGHPVRVNVQKAIAALLRYQEGGLSND